jgi:AraC-like DNA-binding protein
VRAATGEADFLRAPQGASITGRSFVYHCARPDLVGFSLWGSPDADELRALERVLEVELREGFPPHDSLVDMSRVEHVDPTAFAVFAGYVDRHRARLRSQVTKLAMVRPTGVAGATIAGFFHVASPPYPIEIVADAKAALAWLGHRDDGLLEELEALVAAATGAPALLVSLRRALDAKPGRLALDDAARALGVSERSLQRKLKELGSTYQAEVARSQLRVAQALLRESSTPLAAIAFEVGCATPQHFSSLFRRIAGESPSEWRAKHGKR